MSTDCLVDIIGEKVVQWTLVSTKKMFESNGESKDVSVNKKIAELKKKIILAGNFYKKPFSDLNFWYGIWLWWTEGQRKAVYEEWEHIEKKSNDSIAELKKEIKELTSRLISYINIADGKYSSEVCEATRTVNYPNGADTAQKALEIYDLSLINQTKKYDLLEAEFVKRKEHHNKLLRLRAELSINIPPANASASAEDKSSSEISKFSQMQAPPLTIEEDESRKHVCHLENEILRINVQWSQAEHIRKKYKSIKSSLMSDAEKFEKNLLEIENALRQQNADIDNMKVTDNIRPI